MNTDQLANLVARYWEAEAAYRSDVRDERMRVNSWSGDLYRVENEVEEVMSDPRWADSFLLAAANYPGRPEEDWVVAWLGGGAIEDCIRNGDTQILERLIGKGFDASLAQRIRAFIG